VGKRKWIQEERAEKEKLLEGKEKREV